MGDFVGYVSKLVMSVVGVCGVESDVFVDNGGGEPSRLRASSCAIDLPWAAKGCWAF